MIYPMRVFLMLVFVVYCAEAFRMMQSAQSSSSLSMALKDYKEELAKTAAAIAAPGEDLTINIMERACKCS